MDIGVNDWAVDAAMPLASPGPVSSMLADELDSLSLLMSDGRGGYALKTLDERGGAQELIRQQYSGRYPFELLQNANDAAAEASGIRRVMFEVTASALLVANMGSGFSEPEVRALCSLGRSSKDPRKSIGYKGLGFKAVGEITDAAQVFSPPYCYGFDAERVRGEVEQILGVLPEGQRLPSYAFPFPLEIEDAGDDSAQVSRFLAEGFVTVVRLPFRPGVAPADVQRHVAELLVPELLLFLDATDSLTVRGVGADWTAGCSRERRDGHDLVILAQNEQARSWLVFQHRLALPDRSLVADLGRGWAKVTEVGVAVAVALDRSERPSAARVKPLHVYFPLQDTAGVPLMMHADFVLDLDRRHVSTAPEAQGYNSWLAGELIRFVAGTVAPKLADMFPADTAVVSALVPTTATKGFGETILAHYNKAIGQVQFIACQDGSARSARECVLLPAEVPNGGSVGQYCDFAGIPNLALAGEPLTAEADRWLRDTLQATSLSVSGVLTTLRDPGPPSTEFYIWLVEWYDGLNRLKRDQFVQALASTPCIRTTAGEWVSPSSVVFFPRERQSEALPAEVPVQIADLPDLPGLRDLLTAAGVNPFRWREILVHHVLPLLTSHETSETVRHRAHSMLRSYLDSDDPGDQDILKRLGDVLLLAKDIADTTHSLRPARRIYLGKPWTGTDDLERLYGPFGACEFLAEPIADEPDLREGDLRYWLALGVQTRPIICVPAEASARYRLEDLYGHPFARQEDFGPYWGQWARSSALRQVHNCGQAHSSSQQLTISGIDRLHHIVASGDAERLHLMATNLSKDWARYKTVLTANVRCAHQNHHGQRDRATGSAAKHLLTESEWVPAIHSGSVVLRRPREIWLYSPGLPAAIRQHLTFLDHELATSETAHVWTALGVADSARPTVEHLTRLLRDLADHSQVVADEDASDIARWAIRNLNDALAGDTGSVAHLDDDIPLLATLNGQLTFHTQPYITDDPVFKEVWGDICPILAADSGLATLAQRLNLPRLSDHVHIEPVAHEIQPQESVRLRHELAQVLPYIAAVALAAAPSRQGRIRRRLRDLDVVACGYLELASKMDGHVRHHPVTAFAGRQVTDGSASDSVAYLQISTPNGEPDWYAFGPRLAKLLDMPAHADAFTLLLTSNANQRTAYLRSRSISLDEALLEAADEETEDQQPRATPRASKPATTQEEASVAAPSSSQSQPPSERQMTTDAAKTSSQLPPLDPTVYRMTEAPTAATATASSGMPVPAPISGRRTPEPHTAGDGGAPNFDENAKTAIEHGKRGEQWAYQQECLRLRQRGLDPAQVLWISRENESANHDLRSIDDDGEPIFIEVKATSGTDLAASFEITSSELAMAHRHGRRYFIYHVLEPVGKGYARLLI